ncbi:HhH-GDP family DNA glycosylase [Lacrimispora brassicae]
MDNIEQSIEKIITLLNKIPSSYQEVSQRTPYHNMAATLTDAVLQAGMNYRNVVYPRICNILDNYEHYKTTCDFIILFQTYPIEKIIQWKNKTKQNTICKLTWFLYGCGVNNEEDLANWLMFEENQNELLKIKGIGFKTVDYLKLLSGQQAIPIDRHMFQFLEMSNIITSNYKEASFLLKKTAHHLNIGESTLDKVIWDFMSSKNDTRQITLEDVFGKFV